MKISHQIENIDKDTIFFKKQMKNLEAKSIITAIKNSR